MGGHFKGGSTATVAVIVREDDERVMYLANIGDSRGVWFDNNDRHATTLDHSVRLQGERDRVQAVGGKCSDPKENHKTDEDGNKICTSVDHRLNDLAVSRAFGDFALKNSGLVCVPDVQRIPIGMIQGIFK